MDKQLSSDHFEMYFSNNEFISNDKNKILEFQEQCYSKVVNTLGYDPKICIRLVLFNSSIECGISYDINTKPEDAKPKNAFCYLPNTIHATYNAEVKAIGCHEVAHLLLENMLRGFPAIQLDEGFAVFCDDYWDGLNLNDWVNKKSNKDQIGFYKEILATDEGFYKYGNDSYPIVGCYTQWLIRNKGIPFFINLANESLNNKQIHTKYIDGFITYLVNENK